MGAMISIEQPLPGLLAWLESHDIEYEIREHPRAFTAVAVAKAEGIDPHAFAKVVGVVSQDGFKALVVLDAPDRLDLAKARRHFGHGEVRLMSEHDLTALAPGCEVGALPAIGDLFGVPTIADYAVRDDPEISFNAGSHRFSAHVDRIRWERASDVTYADLAVEVDEPVWAR